MKKLVRVFGRVFHLSAMQRLGIFALAGLALFSSLRLLSQEIAIWGTGVFVLLVGVAALTMALLRRRRRTRKTDIAALRKGGDERAALEEVQQSWMSALDELTSAGLSAYSLPWFLLLGEPGSGKSTLLRHSDLEFPVGTDKLSSQARTESCDWWFANDGVVLDTAGRLTFEEAESVDELQWDEFRHLLRRFRRRCPLNGVILTIPSTSLLTDDSDEIARKAATIRERLGELEQTLGVQFPVFVLVTKCDQILGFSEFVSRFPTEERNQILGWSKPGPHDSAVAPSDWPSIARDFRSHLARWRNRLLSDEPDARDVDRLYAFNEEFASLGGPLTRYLEEIFVTSRYLDPLYLRGVYFTSAEQSGRPLPSASPTIGATGRMVEEEVIPEPTACFVQDLFREKIFRESGLVDPSRLASGHRRRHARVAFGVGGAAAALILAALFFGWQMQSKKLGAPSTHLAEFQESVESWEQRSAAEARLAPTLHPALAFTTSVEDVARGSLDLHPALERVLTSHQETDTLGNLAQAHEHLLQRSVLRHFGDLARDALRDPPKSWTEYLEYEDAALCYFALIGAVDSTPLDANIGSQLDSHRWGSLGPLVRLIRSRNTTVGDLSLYVDLHRRMLLLHAQAGLPRPSLRAAFRPTTSDVARVLGGIRDFCLQTTEGMPTILERDGLEIVEPIRSAGIWLRLAELDSEIEKSGRRLIGFAPERLVSLDHTLRSQEQWRETLLGEPDGLEPGLFRRFGELKGLVSGTDPRPLRPFDASLRGLVERFRRTLDEIEERSPRGEAWSYRARVESLRGEIDLAAQDAETRVTQRLTACEAPFSVVVAGAIEGVERPNAFEIRVNSPLTELVGYLQQCLHAVEVHALAEVESPWQWSRLHEQLRDRFLTLQQTMTWAGASDGVHAEIAAHVENILRATQGIVLTRAIRSYRLRLPEATARTNFVADFVSDESRGVRIPVVDLGERGRITVAARHHHTVADRVLQHLNDLLRIATECEDRILDNELERLRKAVLDVARDYFVAYQKEWRVALESFSPELPDKATWDDYRLAFQNGFEVAPNGLALADNLENLIEQVLENVDFRASLQAGDGSAERLDPALVGVVERHLHGRFESFFQVYTPATSEEAAPATELMAAYRDHAEAIQRISGGFAEPREFVFRILDREEKSNLTNREILAHCEETILGSSTLRADHTAKKLLRVVQLGRRVLEQHVLETFNTEWQGIGTRFLGRVRECYPFEVVDSVGRPYGDANWEDFVLLRQAILRSVGRLADASTVADGHLWWSLLPPKEHGATRVSLRLPRPEIISFCERVSDWGRFLGFDSDQSSLIGVRVTVNYEDPTLDDPLSSIALARTDLSVLMGSSPEPATFGGGQSPEITGDWDFGSSSRSRLAFALYREGQVDGATVWPPAAEHPAGWLALPRLLLEYRHPGWRGGPHERLIRAEFELPEATPRKYRMFCRITLPEDRVIPERPNLDDAHWRAFSESPPPLERPVETGAD